MKACSWILLFFPFHLGKTEEKENGENLKVFNFQPFSQIHRLIIDCFMIEMTLSGLRKSFFVRA